MNIVFFGTPDFALPLPQALLETEFNLVAVVTNPDRPFGRKQILTASPVKKWAQDNQIPVLAPERLDENFLQTLTSQYPNIQLGVLAAYGKIIPQKLIDLFPLGILVVHPSLLPKYRGASPVQTAIINGDQKTGVSIIRMDERMDHGPIISEFTEEIKPDDTAESLYTRLFKMSADALMTILPNWVQGKITPRKQDHSQATFTKLLKKEDGKIDWSWEAKKLERFIRAMTPWPGAWTLLHKPEGPEGQTKRLKILKAHLEKGKLILDQVQLEGEKPISWQQFNQRFPETKIK